MMEKPNVSPATLALADELWNADMRAVTIPGFRREGGGQAFVTLINSKSKTAVREEGHREDGELLRWGFSIILVIVLGFASLITVGRVIDAKQAAVAERGLARR